ncbi:MAG: hypothetical protein JSW48_08470 [Betaproteobacteria bacterium]|nr:MAG: hypothetical protein JSW48_08470 [Betaproteobacteria bacterium]
MSYAWRSNLLDVGFEWLEIVPFYLPPRQAMLDGERENSLINLNAQAIRDCFTMSTSV